MDAIRKALAVTLKDLRVASKDRAYLISMILFPLVIAVLNSSVFSSGSQGISLPVILVNQDAGVYGAAIGNVLAGIPQVEVEDMSSPDSAAQRVASGEFLAVVVIPADFTQRIDDYQPTEVTVILDPAQASYGRILTSIVDEIAGSLAIQGEIRYGIRSVLSEMGSKVGASPEQLLAAQAQTEGVLFTQMQRMETESPIRVDEQTLRGKQVFAWDNVVALMLPGLTVMFAFFILPAVSTELLKEKEVGALRRLVASPLPRGSLIGGKVLAYLLIVMLQVGLLFGIGAVFLDMPLGDSPMGLLLTTVALGLVATTLGMMIAALVKTIDQAGSISMLIIFVLGFLGGSFAPNVAFYRGEGILAIISRLTPQAQAQIAYLTLILQQGNVLDILPQIAYLLALSLLFFLIAIWRFRFDS